MMWFLLLLCIAQLEQVITQDDNRHLILEDGPCEGYVKLFNGTSWYYVGDDHWNSSTEKVVCKSTHCGIPVKDSTNDEIRHGGNFVLSEVKCNGEEKQLWDCKYPTWDDSTNRKQTVKSIKCSNEIKIDLDGFKCAGAVRYSTDGIQPSGYFCSDNWETEKAQRLCESLGCGDITEVPTEEWMVWDDFYNLKNMKMKCPDNQRKHLWQCAKEEGLHLCSKPASVICSNYERLQLRGKTSNACSGNLEIEKNNTWTEKNLTNNQQELDEMCRQMYCGKSKTHKDKELTCSDNVTVALTQTCYGTVQIKVNDTRYSVCASSSSSSSSSFPWDKKNAEMVCKELNCGKPTESRRVSNRDEGIMDFVNCTGNESSLWHCKGKRHTKPFQCNLQAYVVCSGSINASLKDGPGKCAGRLKIEYDGKSNKVYNETWTEENSHTVCRQLNCGNTGQTHGTEVFGPDSNQFLQQTVTCKQNASNISECSITTPTNPSSKNSGEVGITCAEHKVIFLEGENACSGKVGIEQGGNIYWLSGSKKTWNNESAGRVCQQKHCGGVQSFNNIRSDNKTILNTSYNCSSSNGSLFDCENTTLPSDHNDTIATVKCTGKINITLTKGCWGDVEIYTEVKRGAVCKDTWTDNMSSKLCKQLGCQKASETLSKPGDVIFKSLHMLKNTDDLAKSSFVSNDDACKNVAHVVCSGSIKPRFEPQNSADKCSGNLEIEYQGKWLPVCNSTETNVLNTICKELKCGLAGNTIDYFNLKSDVQKVISVRDCKGESLKTCHVSRKDYSKESCVPVGLQCSEWKKITLTEKACSGPVLLLSQGGHQTVSKEGFLKEEGKRLCKDLNCGNFNKTVEKAGNNHDTFWNGSFDCTGVVNPKNIWDCHNNMSQQLPAQSKWLSIKCDGEPKVTLSEECKGEVKINGIEVCGTDWKEDYSHMVCREKGCNKAIASITDKRADGNKKYYHVKCDEHHRFLGQCKRIKGRCEKLVSVYCVANVKFKTTEKCGGLIEANYQDTWEKVCLWDKETESHKSFKDLCRLINCSRAIDPPKGLPQQKQPVDKWKTSLQCTDKHNDIKHCVNLMSCENKVPAAIYCGGYVPPKEKPKANKTSVVPIILGVGFLLVLVILIVVFVRICIIKKAKNVTSRMFSRKEVEFESGDVEDFDSRGNEMAEFGHGRGFRSEAEFMEEQDRRSNSSFSYDDIDEAGEARALTSRASSTGTSGDNYIPESALDQSADGVTYEVEDPQESYDDIEASPENTQTRAEVHDGPKTAPEKEAVSAGLVPGDEDYLVPGQDG